MYETPEACTAEFIRGTRAFLDSPSPVRHAGEPRVRIFAGGFLAYVFGQSEMAVAALDVPGWTHCYRVLVPFDCLVDQASSELFQRDENVSWVVPNGWDVTLVVEDGAPLSPISGRLREGTPEDPTDARSWEIIDLVPDFAEFCIGARLAPDWSTRPGVLSTLRVTGGEVSSVPIQTTFQYSWSWTGRDGHEHRQPITDVLKCESDAPKGASLDFRERGGNTHLSVRLKPGPDNDIPILMLAVPQNWDPDPSLQYRLDLAHLHATLGICEWDEDVRCVLNPARHEISQELRPRPPAVDPFFRTMRAGTLNCGGRRLSAR
jgi:hypothetical protein